MVVVECYMVSVLSKRTMLTGGFFVLLRVVFLLRYSPRLSLSLFFSVPQGPFEPLGSLWWEVVVVRGYPGDIPVFSIEIWILGCNGCCVLAAGKFCPQCLSIVSVCRLSINVCFSYFALTRVADSLEWYGYMLASSCAWSSEAYHCTCLTNVHTFVVPLVAWARHATRHALSGL